MAEMPTDIKVDAVTLIEVIEHVDDPVTFMSEIKDKLKPGGKLFITTPAGDVTDNWFSRAVKSYISRFKVEKQSLGAYKSEFHIHFFTEDSLQLCLKRAGFGKIKFEYIDQLYPRDRYKGFDALKRVLKTKLKLALRGRTHLTGFVNKG